MTERERKIQIVETMVAEGYHIFHHTVEEFADMETEAHLLRYLEKFREWKEQA